MFYHVFSYIVCDNDNGVLSSIFYILSAYVIGLILIFVAGRSAMNFVIVNVFNSNNCCVHA